MPRGVKTAAGTAFPHPHTLTSGPVAEITPLSLLAGLSLLSDPSLTSFTFMIPTWDRVRLLP